MKCVCVLPYSECHFQQNQVFVEQVKKLFKHLFQSYHLGLQLFMNHPDT